LRLDRRPHTQKKEFASRTHLHAGSALLCPAVFWIVERLRVIEDAMKDDQGRSSTTQIVTQNDARSLHAQESNRWANAVDLLQKNQKKEDG